MTSRVPRLVRTLLRPFLRPIREQLYAWIDYRIRCSGIPNSSSAEEMRNENCPTTPSFSDVIPQLLNAISTVNAVVRGAKRSELALQARLDELASRIAGHASAYLTIEEVSPGPILRISGEMPGVPVSTFDLPVEPGRAAGIHVIALLESMPVDVVTAKLLPHFHSCLCPGGYLQLQVADAAALISALGAGQLDLAELESALGLHGRNGMLGLYEERRLRSAMCSAGFNNVRRKEGPTPYQLVLEGWRPGRQLLNTTTTSSVGRPTRLST